MKPRLSCGRIFLSGCVCVSNGAVSLKRLVRKSVTTSARSHIRRRTSTSRSHIAGVCGPALEIVGICDEGKRRCSCLFDLDPTAGHNLLINNAEVDGHSLAQPGPVMRPVSNAAASPGDSIKNRPIKVPIEGKLKRNKIPRSDSTGSRFRVSVRAAELTDGFILASLARSRGSTAPFKCAARARIPHARRSDNNTLRTCLGHVFLPFLERNPDLDAIRFMPVGVRRPVGLASLST